MSDRPKNDAADSELPEPPRTRGADQTVWVGLFLVFGLVATLIALLVLTDAAIFRGRYIVLTHVSNAGGIRRGDPVQMRGVNIGRVLRFEIAHDDVTLQLEIEGEYKVPKDSKVELRSAGLLGGLVADVIPGTSTERAKYGDTLPGSSGQQLTDATSNIAKQVEAVTGRLDTLLAPETIQNVQGSAEDVRKIVAQLKTTVNEQRTQIAELTASLRRASSGVERATGPELERAVKRLDTLSERMDKVSASLDRSSQSLEGLLGRIDRGEGTLGKLTKDPGLYDNLNEAARGLNRTTEDIRKLTEDIRKNPKRYLKFSVF